MRIKASSSSVVANIERPTDRGDAGIIWIENHSTDTVTVSTVALHECENIRQTCEVTIPVSVLLPPDSRHAVLRVLRQSAGGAWNVTYTYEWISGGTIHHGTNAVEKQLRPGDITKLGDKIAFLRAEPDSVVVDHDGGVLVASQLHIVALGVQHELLGRFRGTFSFRVQAGPVKLIPPDTLIGVARGRAVLTVTPEIAAGSRKTLLEPLTVALIVK